MMLYEGAFRAGEIGEMRWKDLNIDGTGLVVHVTFKTEKHRYVRLVMAREHLIKWKSEYRSEIGDDGFVFVSGKMKPLSHAAITRLIQRLVKRAQNNKHITLRIYSKI